MSTVTATESATPHRVVPDSQWLEARKQLLAREKELTRLHDQVAGERRALPWRRIDKEYLFDTREGPRTLGQLFAGRRQLMVQHSCSVRTGSRAAPAARTWRTTPTA